MSTLPEFSILAATTITNTGLSIIEGKIGVYPGTSITGFPPGKAELANSADCQEAQEELDALWASLNTLDPAHQIMDLSGKDLGGMVLGPGVYKFSSSAELTGTLILDGKGDPDSRFIFHIGSTLTTATDAQIILKDAALSENVFWLVGSSATLGTGTRFDGKILAYASITLNTAALIDGALWARTGAVTLDDNLVNL